MTKLYEVADVNPPDLTGFDPDTTFYVLTLYFGSIGIKKIRYAMWAGLCADLIGIIASITIVNLLF